MCGHVGIWPIALMEVRRCVTVRTASLLCFGALVLCCDAPSCFIKHIPTMTPQCFLLSAVLHRTPRGHGGSLFVEHPWVALSLSTLLYAVRVKLVNSLRLTVAFATPGVRCAVRGVVCGALLCSATVWA